MKAITIIMKKAEEFNSNDNMLAGIIQKQLPVKTIKYCYGHTCTCTYTHTHKWRCKIILLNKKSVLLTFI